MTERSLMQIRDALLSYAEEEYDWASFGEWHNYSVPKGSIFDVEGIGSVRVVDYHGYDSHKNHSDWSEDLWIVFEIKDVLYKATGTYTSFIGEEWNDDLKIVKRKQKVVYFYE
jgi:hypothetical protein